MADPAITVRVDAAKGANLDQPFKQMAAAAGRADDVVRAFASDMAKATRGVDAFWESAKRGGGNLGAVNERISRERQGRADDRLYRELSGDGGSGPVGASDRLSRVQNRLFRDKQSKEDNKLYKEMTAPGLANRINKNSLTEFNSGLDIASRALKIFNGAVSAAASFQKGGIAGGLEDLQESFGGAAGRSLYLGAKRAFNGGKDPAGVHERGSILQRAKAEESLELMQKDMPALRERSMRLAMESQGRVMTGSVREQLGFARSGTGTDIRHEQNINVSRDFARERSQRTGGLGQLEIVRQQAMEAGIKTPQQVEREIAGMGQRSRAMQEVSAAQREVDFQRNQKGMDPGVKAQRVAAAQGGVVEAQRKLLDAEQKQLDLVKQQSQERLSGLQAAKDATQSIIDAEQAKLKGGQQEFGRMNEWEREQVMDIAKRFKQTGKLEDEDLAIARQVGIFGDAVAKRDEAAGGAAGFDDLKKLLGLDQRLKEAEKTKVEVINKIELEMKNAGDAMADQIANAIMPAIVKMQQAVIDKLKADQKLADIQAQANKN